MDIQKAALNNEEIEQVTGGTSLSYIIQGGDTLGKLAQKYHCTVEELCKWNDIKNADSIAAGQKLVIKF